MSRANQLAIWLESAGVVLYVLLVAFLFYLLAASRTGEARTVWEALNPAFLPTLFVTAFLLVAILLMSDRTSLKLTLVIVFSILVHSLFSIIFPAGDLSGQQLVLGRTRRVFDNTAPIGWSGLPTTTVQAFVFELFKGVNLQAALSTIFARMLNVDILYVHLSLVPTLWGIFVPIASFLAAKEIGGSDKTSVLSSMIISAFPYTIYFGAISVQNSLGFIFFFYSLYFMQKYLRSNSSKDTYFMLIFCFFAFLAHYLTGIMSISLLFLVVTFKAYSREKSNTRNGIWLIAPFLFSVSLLPLSLIYLRFFASSTNVVFTLDKFSELPLSEIVGLFFLGELIYGFDLKTIFVIIIGPLIALTFMLYLVYKMRKNSADVNRVHIYFLSAAFLLILIDYRILKLFMSGLPLNEERLWVFRDFIAAPFVTLAIYAVISDIETRLKARSRSVLSYTHIKTLSKDKVLHTLGLVLVVNLFVSIAVAGWITLSLDAGYPHFAPLQTTWYELEAARIIEKNTTERYVVIGDQWTIFAGEVIVGINNPQAYYFGEFDTIGHNLFSAMKSNPSPKWMLQAMNYTDTSVAYFIVTEPRLGIEEFNNVVTRALQNDELILWGVFGAGRLYVFDYKKG